MQIYDVIVIGGGASGMMAAGVAAAHGKKVALLEKNERLGEKLRITGNGRCNVTNAEFDNKVLLSYYGEAEVFLHSPFSRFSVTDTFSFFESRGVPLMTEERKRTFPCSEKAEDVVRALAGFMSQGDVTVYHSCCVKKVILENNAITGIETDKGVFQARSYVLATGGNSHPETGSTGDGFSWLKEFGHTVKDPTPTIVPLAVEDTWAKSLAGVSISDMKIIFYLEGKKQFSKRGPILFTHFGVSGPLVLNSAARVAALLQSGRVDAKIDVFPDMDLGGLDEYIVKIFDEHKNKDLKTVFKMIVPPGISSVLQSLLSPINFELKVHSVTKDQRKKMVQLLKALPIHITHLMGFDRAVVADGGVLLKEIDMKTMRSKLIGNLFVTGDLLHINRPSGGYSLQLCWTTGYIAGIEAAS